VLVAIALAPSENLSLAVSTRVHMAFRGRAARSDSQYLVGQSLLAAPFHVAGDLLDPLLTSRWRTTLADPVGMQSWLGGTSSTCSSRASARRVATRSRSARTW
jgi:hypothetical protein